MGDDENAQPILPGGEPPAAEAPPRAVAPSTRPGALEPGSTFDRYTVLEKLGEGGMGEVYAAYDRKLDRKVALKLLRNKGEVYQQRLMREAQAMARLSHPNVVAVFDTGTMDGKLFVAMEFVQGSTLRVHQRDAASSWESLLRMYLDAGRGLAAAHAAGLVHRDFKPDNVLVSTDGQCKVTDFGLARTLGDASQGGPPPDQGQGPDPARDRSSGSLGTPMTEEGTLLGTPGYMAPEQYTCEAVDERTDQFAFSVSLYEAIYGEKPFEGTSFDQVVEATMLGRVRDAPRRTTVPAWIRRVLLRGLSAERETRYPSMPALLAALRTDPGARVRRAIAVGAGAAAVLALVATAFGVARRANADRCSGAEKLLAGAWDDAARDRIVADFASVVPGSSAMVASVERTLDAYAGAWVKMRTETCEATRVREEQSENVAVLRTACLDSRLRELHSLTAQLATADKALVLKAAQAAGELTSLAPCADVAALTAVAPRPTDPTELGHLRNAEQTLAEVRALLHLGKAGLAADLAAQTLTEAREAHYLPLEAKVRSVHGTSLVDSASYKAKALPSYERAVAINDAKFGPGYTDTATFLAGLGHCRAETGDLPGALAALERGYALVEKGGDPEQAGQTCFELARVLVRKDPKSRRARDLAREAAGLFEKGEITKKLSAVNAWIADHP